MENVFIYLISTILILNFLAGIVLDYLNFKNWPATLTPFLSEFYTEEKFLKAKSYHARKNKLSAYSSATNFSLLFLFFILGGFGWLNELLLPLTNQFIVLGLIYFLILFFFSDLINIPFGYYDTFVIEEQFGFNKTTKGTYFRDKLKAYFLGFIFGGILLTLLFWFILETGRDFWLYIMVIFSVFIFFLNFLYADLILPIFNKLEPLKEGELKNSIESFARKVGFNLKNVYVMDGSKRSTKANAFFTGIGKKKKIILFDTLINNHSEEEIISILAHETGHYKRKHIPVNIILSILQLGIFLFILSLLVFNTDLSLALGADKWYLHLNLIAFIFLYEPISLVTGLLFNYLSRKFEFQADKYAAENSDPSALISGLKNLSVTHLSNLTPHPVYVFFHYSHPPLIKRIANIKRNTP